ncbi:MAG: UbiX family flavin prenyltransferase [Candidatus Norongarragalinales archaeon]
MRIILCVTGASGINYALAIARELSSQDIETHCIVTENAKLVMHCETSAALKEFKRLAFRVYSEKEIDAPLASGSFRADALIVCPCSMKTLSAIANGFAYNLVTRVADVMLKQGNARKIVLVPREMPWSVPAFENALKLARLGVIVAPASPGFYGKPKTVSDLVDFVAGRVLAAAGIPNSLYPTWEQARKTRPH